MLPDEFWALTWEEYWRRVRGYLVREARQWERTREVLVQQYNLYLPKNKQPLSARKYMPLLTDPPIKQVENADELRALREQIKQKFKPKTP